MKNRKLLLSLLFVVFSCVAKEYVVVDSAATQFKTCSEKKHFFKKINCNYLNDMCIEYDNFAAIHPKKTDAYQSDKKNVDAYSKKYAKEVKSRKLAPMYLAWISKEVGYGVFASQDLKAGDFIGVYAGVLRAARKDNSENFNYAWFYSVPEVGENKLVIDGEFCGNELRFINHAKKANTAAINVIVDNVFYVCYIAVSDVAKGDQLTADYGDGYWSSRDLEPALSIETAASDLPTLAQVIQKVKDLGGKIPSTDPQFLNQAKQVVGKVMDKIMVPVKNSLSKKYETKKRVEKGEEKEVTLHFAHILNPQWSFEKTGPEGYEFLIKGGHFSGTCKKLQDAGLIKIIDQELLPNCCCNHKCELVMSGKTYLKTEYPECWTQEKILKCCWQAFDHPTQILPDEGNGRFGMVGVIEGVLVKLFVHRLDPQPSWVIETCYPDGSAYAS